MLVLVGTVLIEPIGEEFVPKQDSDLASFKFGEESASDSISDIGVIVIDGPIPLSTSRLFGLFIELVVLGGFPFFLIGGGDPNITPVQECESDGKSNVQILLSLPI